MKIVFKRHIPGWKYLSKDEQERIEATVDKSIFKNSSLYVGLICVAITAGVVGIVDKRLGQIGADELQMWLGRLVIVLLLCSVMFVINTMIVNPRIDSVMKERSGKSAPYGNSSETTKGQKGQQKGQSLNNDIFN
jgi:hypothetical protein